ncbi:hypothetical protein GCM10010302_16950 [Streptomyces polychromogenes]|uniref:Restriction endonuclease type IV Mrr domain-containing protein n=1 Tax=Streptomyces polychromogenes TaxID=67342 RepID=A0ABN0V834_9ACTN
MHGHPPGAGGALFTRLSPYEPWEHVLRRAIPDLDLADHPYDQVRAERLWRAEDWLLLEEYTSRRLGEDNCAVVQSVGSSGDGGVDVVAKSPGRHVIAVQCKHYNQPIDATTMKVFHYDTTAGWEDTKVWRETFTEPPRHRLFVTTNTFEPTATRAAQRAGIHLVDATILAVWMGFKVPLNQLLGIERW